MGKRTYTLGQKFLRGLLVVALIAGIGTGAVLGGNAIFQHFAGDKQSAEDPKTNSLDGLNDGEKEEQDEDNLTVDLSRDGADNKYGKTSKYVLQSSFLDMGKIRIKLTGVGQPVSIPMSGNQEWIDNQRRSDMPEEVLYDVLAKKLEEWDEEFSQLKGYELEVAVRNKVKEEIMRNPVFGDMMAQAFLTYPQVVEQNPWLVQFKKNLDEAYARDGSDGKLVGLNAFMHYETAEAKEAKDFSKLVINTEADEKTGAFEYFYDAARVAELFDQFFEFDGRKEKLESTDNWCLFADGDAAMQRTVKSDEQEDKPVYLFTHYTKMRNVSIRMGFNALDRRVELFKDVIVVQEDDSDEPEPTPPSDDPGDGKVKLTILYKYEDGSKAADTFVGYYPKGSYYEVASPVVNNFIPDRAVVKGGPITKDTTEIVIYYKKGTELHNATINYIYRETGKPAATSFTKQMKPGESLTRKSPEIGGYTADKKSVKLEMQHEDLVVNVYYDKTDEDPDFTLTVIYQFTDGSQAAPTHTEKHKAGDSYNVASPVVKDATPDKKAVSGKMPNNDKTEVVTYTKKGENPDWKLTINYVIADGGVAAPASKVETHKQGESYSVTSPTVTGYTPDKGVVAGTMPNHDVTVTVTYTRNPDPSYTVTVNYVIADGQVTAPASKSESHKEGESYNIASPVVSGYVADKASVSGKMPAHDVVETVTYRRQDGNGTKDSGDSSDKKDENDQGTGTRKDGTDDGQDQNEGNEGSTGKPDRTDDGGQNNNNGGGNNGGGNSGGGQTTTEPSTDQAITEDGKEDDWTDKDSGNESNANQEVNNGVIVDNDGVAVQNDATPVVQSTESAVESATPAVQSEETQQAVEESTSSAEDDGDFQGDRPE